MKNLFVVMKHNLRIPVLLHVLLYVATSATELNNSQTSSIDEGSMKITYEFSVTSDRLTLREAAAYCNELGPGWQLPLPSSSKEHQLLVELMLDQAWNSTWTPLKRKIYKRFKWLHGQPFYETMDGKGNCVRLMAEDTLPDSDKLRRSACRVRRRGFVCQKSGACPLAALHSCLDDYQSNLHFTFHCSVTDWFSAKAACENQDGQLAVTDSDTLRRRLSQHLKTVNVPCQHSVWVGLTKVAFEKYNSHQSNQIVPLLPLWHEDEPRTVGHSCVVLEDRDNTCLWSATKCWAKQNSICWKRSSYHMDGGDLDYNFNIHVSKVNMSEAVDVCNSTMGNHWELAELYNNKSDSLLWNIMKTNGITSVWTNIRRNVTTTLKWINGKMLGYGYEGNGKCGRLVAAKNSSGIFHSIIAISCNVIRHGYLCQYNACPEAITCYHIGEWFYSFVKERRTWEEAGQACYKGSGRPAVLEDKSHADQTAKIFLRNGHFEAWIGLTKAEYINHMGTVVSRPVPHIWHRGQPESEKNCVLIKHHNSRYLLATVTCGQKHHVICVKKKPTIWADAACCYYYKMEFFICAAIVAAFVLAIVISIIGFCIYKVRKKHEKPYSDIKKPLVVNTNSSTGSSYTPTPTL